MFFLQTHYIKRSPNMAFFRYYDSEQHYISIYFNILPIFALFQYFALFPIISIFFNILTKISKFSIILVKF